MGMRERVLGFIGLKPRSWSRTPFRPNRTGRTHGEQPSELTETQLDRTFLQQTETMVQNYHQVCPQELAITVGPAKRSFNNLWWANVDSPQNSPSRIKTLQWSKAQAAYRPPTDRNLGAKPLHLHLLRVHPVPEPVPQQIHRQNNQQDGQPGEEGYPPMGNDQFPSIGHH